MSWAPSDPPVLYPALIGFFGTLISAILIWIANVRKEAVAATQETNRIAAESNRIYSDGQTALINGYHALIEDMKCAIEMARVEAKESERRGEERCEQRLLDLEMLMHRDINEANIECQRRLEELRSEIASLKMARPVTTADAVAMILTSFKSVDGDGDAPAMIVQESGG